MNRVPFALGWADNEGAQPGAQLNTANDSLVGVRGDGSIVITDALCEPMRPERALRLAAWIVALADHSEAHAYFRALLAAVEGT